MQRWIRPWDMLHVAAAVLAIALVALVAAYLLAAISNGFGAEPAVAAAVALAIAAAGFLYAWRQPAPHER